MSLNHQEITALVEQLRPLLLNALFLDAWEEGARKIYLTFKAQDQQIQTLLLCLQEPFLRFHLVNQKGKWQQQLLAKKLFYYLEGSHLRNLEQVNEDRILRLLFAKGNTCLSIVIELFSKRPNLFLLDQDAIILASLNPIHISTYHLPKPPLITHTPDQAVDIRSVEQKYFNLEQEAEFQKEKAQLQREIKDKCKRFQKQLKKNEDELKYLLQWPEIQHQAELLQANLYRIKKGMETVWVQDWLQEGVEIELPLDVRKNPVEIVQGLYKKVKRMRGGLERCVKSSEQAANQLEHWQKALEAIEPATSWSNLQHARRIWKISQPSV